MKRFRFLRGLIALIAILTMAVCINCRGGYKPPRSWVTPDSAYIVQTVDNMVNPLFTTAAEVLTYQDDLIEEIQVNDALVEIPADVLMNVATVAIKKRGSVRKKDIVEEYRSNQQIYDNLTADPSTPTENNSPSTAMEEQQKPAVKVPTGTTTIRYENDTVDGVPYKVCIRTERTYEN